MHRFLEFPTKLGKIKTSSKKSISFIFWISTLSDKVSQLSDTVWKNYFQKSFFNTNFVQNWGVEIPLSKKLCIAGRNTYHVLENVVVLWDKSMMKCHNCAVMNFFVEQK